MGVVAIPLLVWGGFALEHAIGIVIPNVLVQTSLNCWQNRRHLPWSDVWLMFALRAIGIPLGILVLRMLSDSGQDLTRQILGAGIVAMLVLQRVSFSAESSHAARWTIPTGLSSGFFAGLIGMGGPPLVLWVMAQGWSSERQRSFLWLSFLLIMPIQMLAMWIGFGTPILQAMAVGICVAPLTMMISWWGAGLGNALSQGKLRWMMQIFLLLIALRLVLGRWWQIA